MKAWNFKIGDHVRIEKIPPNLTDAAGIDTPRVFNQSIAVERPSRPETVWPKAADPSEDHYNCARFVLKPTSLQPIQAYSSQTCDFT